MIDVLLLRFDAPLMSFGGVLVDNIGITQAFPTCSMIAGLLGNALGFNHEDSSKLQSLQDRIRFGARCDRRGREIVDFHTVDLGQHFLGSSWTTRGQSEGRAGGSSEGTHIRKRHFLADAVFTIAVTLISINSNECELTMSALENALREPERPLFLGRKTCLPSAPIFLERALRASIRNALELASPIGKRADSRIELPAWWPADETEDDSSIEHATHLIPVTDTRDWLNQIHVGQRYMCQGKLSLLSQADTNLVSES